MKAVIMAGGEGTRLRPLTCSLPKPMVRLCGRPVSEYILDLLAKNGCTEAVFTLRYKGTQIEKHFETGLYKGIALDFSYEDSPLGTAGAVKKAVEACFLGSTDNSDKTYNFDDFGDFNDFDSLNNNEDILIISGDAICDFDLSKLMNYHKSKKAYATILTKSVEDPREYGCVISSDGFVSGFSEKPSYMGAVSDKANTGIYVISKKVLDLIPPNTMWDFSKDLFPKLLREKLPLAAFEGEGYWCDIGDLESYKKCQQDMLEGLVVCDFDNYSQKYSQEKIKINRPVYIGENVKIGIGTVIEKGTVIESNATVGKNCKLRQCVISEGAFLSDKTKCCGSIICENAIMEQGSAAYENSVLGYGSILGKDSSLEPSVKVWDNKKIPSGVMQRENVKYGFAPKKEIGEKSIDGETNAEITPTFMTVLGSAAESVFLDKVIVACGSGNAAAVLKACFCGGFSGAGGKITDCGVCSLPALIHLSRVMNAKGLVYIEASSDSKITLLNKGGLPLTRVQERKMEQGINRGDYPNAHWDSFGEIKTFKNSSLLYSTELEEASNFSCRYNVKLNCSNPLVSAAADYPFKKISNTKGEILNIGINREGTKAEFFVSESEKADYADLVTIVGQSFMEKGQDVAVPLEFPSVMEEAAKSISKTSYAVKRFYQCSNDNSDREARELAANQPFLFDGLLLSLNALEIITQSYVSLGQYVDSIPQLKRENRFLTISCPPQKIISRLAKGQNSQYSEGVFLDGVGESKGRVLLRSNKKGNGLYMYAEAYSQETAKALCDDVEERVRKMLGE